MRERVKEDGRAEGSKERVGRRKKRKYRKQKGWENKENLVNLEDNSELGGSINDTIKYEEKVSLIFDIKIMKLCLFEYLFQYQ